MCVFVCVAGEGTSPCSHSRVMPALLPAWMGDRDWWWDQFETRVRIWIYFCSDVI